ncbi:fgf protein [Thysanoplusia orichalcea nucleopolyhedrovirus]|uniref:Fgf protein n=1 Tax=Thysanoplusia orichalcea nucleopolyhedrovirus TaxID=101850 RepID=L0CLQ0_9ABAC|nr:fgf protein [Thysanoplusia orichalcea nucleopolyhedrovirus]AGA16186.1 fgf protein [Thysanoplusia orichalcea nucleopolyhedrovirus]
MHRLLTFVALVSLTNGSALLGHITGTSIPVQLFVNRQYLAVTANGAVYGTTVSDSINTVFRRVAGNSGRIIIQNAITCMYLCMDRCGQLYGSKGLSRDCFINESMEENNYNTYYKVYDRKMSYVALANDGSPRRLQISRNRKLGKLSVYALALSTRLDFSIHTTCPIIKKQIVMQHRKCHV